MYRYENLYKYFEQILRHKLACSHKRGGQLRVYADFIKYILLCVTKYLVIQKIFRCNHYIKLAYSLTNFVKLS